jgi:hypothetical protein
MFPQISSPICLRPGVLNFDANLAPLLFMRLYLYRFSPAPASPVPASPFEFLARVSPAVTKIFQGIREIRETRSAESLRGSGWSNS